MSSRVSLRQLYPEPDDSVHKAPPIVDIVLIHGVNGDPIKTWECKNDSKSKDTLDLPDTILWPRDLLPRRFPRARVFTFGYNADIYQNNSLAGIRDLAKTLLSYLALERRDADSSPPVIFVAHCLGGMILKQALHTAHYERDYNGIAEATSGIFFFGTPHVASSKDQWDHLAKAYSSLDQPTGWLKKRSRLVKALQKDSVQLMDMMDKFRHMLVVKDPRSGKPCQRWAIGNFYELEVMPGAKAVIVDQTAAQLDALDEEVQKAVHADHVGMCRFESANNPTFKELCAQIEKLIPKGNFMGPAPPANSSTEMMMIRSELPGTDYVMVDSENAARSRFKANPTTGRVLGEVHELPEHALEDAENGRRPRYLLTEQHESHELSAQDLVSSLRQTPRVPVPVTATGPGLRIRQV